MAGITAEMMQTPDKIESIEIILENISSLKSFEAFTHLTELSVVRCRVEKIEDLGALKFLRKLWLSENKIGRIEGLDHCASLEVLVLFNNTIPKIENLDSLKSLKTLDISQNRIETIENLGSLQKLEKLNLAMNLIEKVGHRLKNLRALRELNLSGNRINEVEEIRPLREMTHLKVLYFFDPHYGENPICKIYNYQTYMLFNFDFLDKFDSLSINDESKKSAVIEFKRKRIYYNMKTKSLRRLFNTVEKILKAVKDKKRELVLAEMRLLGQFKAMIGEKHAALAQQASKDWQLKSKEEEHIPGVYEEFRKYIKKQLENHIDFINVELESTGNFM